MGSLMHLLTAHAYVAVIYLRFFYSNGTVEVKLLTSKTHMAPIKGQITPQLELLDALENCLLYLTGDFAPIRRTLQASPPKVAREMS